MFLSQQLTYTLNCVLAEYTGAIHKVIVDNVVTGGSINTCLKIRYGTERFFLKVNSSTKYPRMFSAEAEGLKRIASTGTVNAAEVVSFSFVESEQVLVLRWIEKGYEVSRVHEKLGVALAQMHRHSSDQFGLDHDNYMGSLTQINSVKNSWSEFFIHNRLAPQVELSKAKGFLDNNLLHQFERLYARLDSFYPPEKPSLVHGDLWSGNYLIGDNQEPFLIDPAIAYANREVDIAMTTLFGGFQSSFYDAYNEEFPLQDEWQRRLDLWNLYPLLIHLNLFGVSYLGKIRQILDRFI